MQIECHEAVLEDIIRGALEGVGRKECDSPILCADAIMKVLRLLPQKTHQPDESCKYCRGHGVDPLSDNSSPITCSACQGTGRAR